MSQIKKRYGDQYFDELDGLSWKRKRKAPGKFEKQFLELLNANRDDTILDAGCGTGWHIFNYGTHCKFVVGMDISKVGLKRTAERLRYHKRYVNVQLVCADAQRLPFHVLSFDKILCISLVEHLEHPLQFSSEAYRVLEKNGLIVIGTPNKIDPVYRTLEFMARMTQRRMPLIGHADQTHQKLFTLNSLKNLLRNCGFNILKVKVQYSLLGMKTLGGDLVVGAVKTSIQ
jgi:ubiquinone/menaquinone biosynthesis C-methylase UbiE